MNKLVWYSLAILALLAGTTSLYSQQSFTTPAKNQPNQLKWSTFQPPAPQCTTTSCETQVPDNFRRTVDLLTHEGVNFAEHLCRNGRYAEAEYLLSKVGKMNPQNPRVAGMLAHVREVLYAKSNSSQGKTKNLNSAGYIAASSAAQTSQPVNTPYFNRVNTQTLGKFFSNAAPAANMTPYAIGFDTIVPTGACSKANAASCQKQGKSCCATKTAPCAVRGKAKYAATDCPCLPTWTDVGTGVEENSCKCRKNCRCGQKCECRKNCSCDGNCRCSGPANTVQGRWSYEIMNVPHAVVRRCPVLSGRVTVRRSGMPCVYTSRPTVPVAGRPYAEWRHHAVTNFVIVPQGQWVHHHATPTQPRPISYRIVTAPAPHHPVTRSVTVAAPHHQHPHIVHVTTARTAPQRPVQVIVLPAKVMSNGSQVIYVVAPIHGGWKQPTPAPTQPVQTVPVMVPARR